MKRWKECRTPQARDAALREAFQLAAGKASRAAKFLGVDRTYLYDILRTYGDPRRQSPDTLPAPNTADSVGSSGTVDRPDTTKSVGRSSIGSTISLTAGRRGTRLPAVATVPPDVVADLSEKFSSPRLTGEARSFARRVALEVEELTGRTEALSLAVELMVLFFRRTSGGDARAVAEQLLATAAADRETQSGTEGGE